MVRVAPKTHRYKKAFCFPITGKQKAFHSL